MEWKRKLRIPGAVLLFGGIPLILAYEGSRIIEAHQEEFAETYQCYSEETKTLIYDGWSKNDHISVVISGNEEDSLTLEEETEFAIDIINRYLRENRINLPSLRLVEDEEFDIRIRDIESFLQNSLEERFSIEDLSPTLDHYVDDRPLRSYLGHTNFLDLDLDHDIDQVEIVVRNYSLRTEFNQNPIDKSSDHFVIEPFLGETPEEMPYFIFGTPAGEIFCLNVSETETYRQCGERDQRRLYGRLIVHELLHAIGIRKHDCDIEINPFVEIGYTNLHYLSASFTRSGRINHPQNTFNFLLGANAESYNEERRNYRVVVPSFGDFIRERLIETHGQLDY